MSRQGSIGSQLISRARQYIPISLRRSYALKIATTFIIIGVVFGGAGLLTTQTFADDVRDNDEEQFAQIASQEAKGIESLLDRHYDNARLIGTDESIANGDPTEIEAHLSSQQESLSASILRIHYIDVRQDTVVASTNEQFQGRSLEEIGEGWSNQLDFDGQRHVSEPYSTFGVTRVAISHRVDARPNRVVTLEVEAQPASTILGDDESSLDQGYVEVVTRGGEVVLGQRPERIGKRYSDGGGPQTTLERAFSSNAAGTIRTDESEFIRSELGGDTYLVSHDLIAGTDWAVLIHARPDEIYGFAQRVTAVGLVVTGLGVLLIGFVGTLVGSHTSRSIDRLVRKAKQIEQGNLNVTFETDRVDNIGRLYREFDRTQASLRDQFEEAILVEYSYDLITVIDTDGQIAYQSPSATHIIGYEPDSLHGECLFDRVHDDDTQAVRAAVDSVAANPDLQRRFEFRMRNADDEWRYFQGVCENHLDNPFVEGLIVSSRDVTERKRKEAELEQSNERLEQFASVVSHDLRNPLHVADGNLDLAEETGDHAKFQDVRDALARMDSMIDELLSMARAETTVEDREAIGLASLASDAWQTARTEGATLEMEADPQVTIDGDRELLHNVFENLFRNSSDHNEPPVTVRVGTLGENVSGVYVEDDGDGIPEGDREEVFDHGHTSTEDGTGLGLSIVRELVAAHGWTITVTEGRDGGARFEIRTDP